MEHDFNIFSYFLEHILGSYLSSEVCDVCAFDLVRIEPAILEWEAWVLASIPPDYYNYSFQLSEMLTGESGSTASCHRKHHDFQLPIEIANQYESQ